MGKFDSLKRTGINLSDGNIHIKISGQRVAGNLERAQMYLDQVVLEDSNKYVPFRSGNLRQSGIRNTVLGEGKVTWETPYAHYQYQGMLYVDPKTGLGAFYSPDYGYWSRKDVPKIPTDRPLRHTTPGTGPLWFETAKRVHGKDWIKGTKRIAGGKI